MICFIALVIQRVMRTKLKAQPGKDVVSPDRALSILLRIQTHRVVLNDSEPISGISTNNPEQLAILESLGIKKPTHTTRYINL